MIWGGSKLLPEIETVFSVKSETVFSAQIEVFSKQKQKKRSFLKFERFFCPNEGVLQKKKKRSSPKQGRYFGNWDAIYCHTKFFIAIAKSFIL